MLRSRLLILLGGCLLTASAAWADDVGYIDCKNYPQDTRVLAKAAKTPEVVTSLPCGERFTILLNGVFFSRIQTKDGKVGYVYSYLISHDPSVTSVRQPTSAQAPAPTSNVPATSATVGQPRPTSPTQPQPTPARPAPAQAPAPTSNVPTTSVTVEQPKPTTPTQPQPTPSRPTPAPAPAPAPTSNVPATSATVEQPRPTAPTQPQPTATQLEVQVPRGTGAGPGWGRPIPGVRREPVVELFAGYAYVGFGSGGYGSNINNGALGSFGWNVKPWLQIVADASYSLAMASGTKNVIYGNHGGLRFFHRGRNKWGASPFIEALFGGTRVDTTVSGPGGYQTSDRGFSIKAGGGLDLDISPHFAIRLFDVNYYRIPFIVSSQNNYWASAGIILRLGGGRPQ